ALRHNLDIQEASANLKAAHQTRKSARAARLPSINASGNASRTRRGDGFREPATDRTPSVAVTPTATTTTVTTPAVSPDTAMAMQNGGTTGGGTGGSTTTGAMSLTTVDYGLSLDASWELDLWGRLRDLDKAATQDYLAAIADFRAARLSLAANTAKSWYDLITARQQQALAEKTLASFKSNLRITERNYKAGDDTTSPLDVQFGRNNVASAERALVSQRLASEEAARTLEVLLGRYPSAELKSGDKLPPLSKQVPTGLPSELLWRRPDLVAAAASLKASARRAKAARKELLPSITLTGGASTSSEALNRMLTDPEFIVWSAAASLAQTVYRGGAPSAEARRALAANEAALRRFASLALRAFREVESSLATERSLAEQEKFLEVELRQATLAEKQSAREYSDGIVGILEILEAQRRAVTARNSMITLRNQRLQNRIDLHLALGGDFSTPPPE
ncbi:MAG: multidrug efflux system outer membrane protein, partial [Verrucomicrobiales bacterium]